MSWSEKYKKSINCDNPKGFSQRAHCQGRKKKMNEANKSGDSSLHDWFSKSKSSDGKPGWVQLGGKYAGKPCAKQPGQTTKPKCGSSKMKRNLSKDEEERAFLRKNRKDPNPERSGKAINVATEEMNLDEKCWVGYNQVGMKKKGKKMVPNCVPEESQLSAVMNAARKVKMREAAGEKDHEYSMARSEIKTVKNAAKRLEKKMGKKGEGNLEAWVQSKITKAADYIDTAADYVTNEEAGEKDACYKKVKSRYKVWPSAYASGALVKCRKKGAANWGNSTKNEEFELCPVCNQDPCQCSETIDEAVRIPAKTGNIILAILTWRGKTYSLKMFFPFTKKPTKAEVQDQISKVYPGSRVTYYNITDYEPGQPLLQVEDWQKVNRQDKTDGLSQKAVDAYRRENPGSKLKTAVTEKNPTGKRAARRKSFCSRMSGMKKRLTSAKTARDPDSRINKALRRWNCN